MRWPIGAVLMPDKTNILIPYVMVCVVSQYAYHAQGWGFTRFNWKTNRFSQSPSDVFRPKAGAPLPMVDVFGSPIILGKRITFYSFVCCSAGSGVYKTAVPLNLTALRNPGGIWPSLTSPKSNLRSAAIAGRPSNAKAQRK